MNEKIKKSDAAYQSKRRASLREVVAGKTGVRTAAVGRAESGRRENARGATSSRRPSKDSPEVSEIEVIRHFTRLSTWNYAIDLGMYPLGSCTMKYNPRVNEFVARLDGIATEHPYQPQELAQGCLKILQLLEKCLLEITAWIASRCSRRRARKVN